VKPSTIRQWIRRGVIEASGADEKGRTLFNRAYVVRTLAARNEVSV
jgi:DNA-binding transcriptional MerR regulator